MRWIRRLRNLSLAVIALPTVSLHAQAPFHQGRTITVIVK